MDQLINTDSIKCFIEIAFQAVMQYFTALKVIRINICNLFVQVLNARDITDLKSSVGHKALFNEKNL